MYRGPQTVLLFEGSVEILWTLWGPQNKKRLRTPALEDFFNVKKCNKNLDGVIDKGRESLSLQERRKKW